MPCPQTITTRPFAIRRQTVTHLLTRRLAASQWPLIILPIVGLCALGIWCDYAFLLVALMFLFLVVPTLVMIAYFNEILRLSAIRSTYTQTVTINLSVRHITVSYAPVDDGDTPVRIDLSPREYTVDFIRHTRFTPKHILILTAPHEYLIIPTDALDPADLLAFESACQ